MPGIFQSTPPRGWRQFPWLVNRGLSLRFQSTPPRGWRLYSSAISLAPFSFQSTPPRGWRQLYDEVVEKQYNFNPLHREGGDADRCPWGIHMGYFNPLHREGGDVRNVCQLTMGLIFQSTPPRGWRPEQIKTVNVDGDFNPLHREGGDDHHDGYLTMM